tara:strand:- start:287 stop:487 length:201 start_codon:yes stop_codon:yes gene_type:complete
MKTYRVTIYHETYTDYIVKAENKNEAEDLCMMGEYNCIDGTTVKSSDTINVEKLTAIPFYRGIKNE